jgi:hypothetical protein
MRVDRYVKTLLTIILVNSLPLPRGNNEMRDLSHAAVDRSDPQAAGNKTLETLRHQVDFASQSFGTQLEEAGVTHCPSQGRAVLTHLACPHPPLSYVQNGYQPII